MVSASLGEAAPKGPVGCIYQRGWRFGQIANFSNWIGQLGEIEWYSGMTALVFLYFY